MKSRRPPRFVPHLARLVLVALLSGCAHRGEPLHRPAPGSVPPGSPLLDRDLDDEHAWVRHHLMFGEFDQALEVLRESPAAPADPLVRALQEGMVLHRSGAFAASNEALAWAEDEVDRRFTLSLSRAAGSLLASDRVLAYTPSAGERAMIPFYRMLNHFALSDVQGALVEARKANALLARIERDPAARCEEDALVRYLAGVVQQAGGERGDALVSLRLAERSLADCDEGAATGVAPVVAGDLVRAARALGLDAVADSVAGRHSLDPPGPDVGAGDLVVLLEHGFVAHRAERALHVPIFPEEIDGLERKDAEGVAAAAARITERMMLGAWERAVWGRSWDDESHVQLASALRGAYLLRLAWPVARGGASRAVEVRVWVDDSLHHAVQASDLSSGVQRELEAERPAMLARLVARGLAKYLLSREMEKTAEGEGGELAGFLVGRLSNLAANELERADTRSWSLLPDRISLVRARLPAGVHRIRIETIGPRGEVLSRRELPQVRVRAGELALLSERVWGSESGDEVAWSPGGVGRTR